ncbi:hypothetical protein EP758_21750 [Escherichia coli]|nr:hypothetical protein [Escherichia coli]
MAKKSLLKIPWERWGLSMVLSLLSGLNLPGKTWKISGLMAMLFIMANLFRVDQMIRQWERSQ